jgi:hypothetical protein
MGREELTMQVRGRGNPGTGSGPPRYPGTFLVALGEAVAGLGWQTRRWLGEAIECLDAGGEQRTIGLENLYRQCRRAPRTDWPTVIRAFLTSVSIARQEAEPTDLAAVADQLLVRLGRPFAALPQSLHAWSRPLAGTDLVLNLVIDFPRSMTYVTQDLVADSGRPDDEWLARALANLRERTPADAFQTIHEDSGMLLCSVGDAYDAARALLLDTFLPTTGELGCFVALPYRDELLVLPVSGQALAHIHLLRVLAQKSFADDPYPITDQVFWVKDGAWHPFTIDVGDKEVSVRPPKAFLPILERLGGPDGGAHQGESPPDALDGP